MKPKVNPAVLAVLTTHWAMEPTALAQMERSLLALPSTFDVAAKYAPLPLNFRTGLFDGENDDASPKPRKPYEMAGGIAVLRLSGPLQKDPSWLMRYYGGTSTRAFIAMLALAEGDPDVGAICVVPDSPGGDVDGTSDAADAVYAVRMRGKKPIVAVVDGCCCSAAYWIASQCSKVYGGQTSVLGSIGTRWSLIDTSAAYEMLGFKKIEITSGTYKAAGADGLPISDESQAYFQGIVDDMQSRFSAAVVRGRKMSTDAVNALAADAKIYVGKAAQSVGLIDDILTVGDVVRQLQKNAATSGTTASTERTGAIMADNEKKGFRAAFTDFMAQFSADSLDSAPTAEAAAPVPGSTPIHPVLTAALAAGLDTPEKLTALVSERKARQEADTTAAQQALTAARDLAQNAAVAAFGQGTAQLQEAQNMIAAQDNPGVLNAMASAYKSVRPTNMRPGAGRQTKAEQAQTTDEALASAPAVKEGLDPAKVYAKRRGK